MAESESGDSQSPSHGTDGLLGTAGLRNTSHPFVYSYSYLMVTLTSLLFRTLTDFFVRLCNIMFHYLISGQRFSFQFVE